MLIKLKNIVIYFLGLIFISSTIEAQHPQINEVCAANIDILFDEDNDNTDWIEIYNPGPGIVNLNGYSLSDNADSLMKWVFPPYNLEEDAFLVVFASKKSTGSQPLFWNALITEGDVWKYQIPTSEPPAEWRSPGFNDGSWSSGATGIGYGDNDDATVVDAGTISVYLRKSFTVSDIDQIEKLIFSLDYDDGFIAYLNGVEIGRMNLESTAGPLPYYTTALEYTEPLMISGAKPLEIDITNKIPLLTSGENVLAIQVHNHSSGSSDLSIIPFLSYQSASKKLEDPDPVLGLSSSSFHANFKIDKDGETKNVTTNGPWNLYNIFRWRSIR